MKGYKVTKQDGLQIVDMPSEVGAEQIKIKVSRSAISQNDIQAYQNKIDSVILGRHCIGMVVEVGSNVKNFVRGDKVFLSPYFPCGECLLCATNRPYMCEQMSIAGQDRDGFLRDFVVLDTKNAYKLPESIADTDTIFIEQTAIALQILSKLNVTKGEHLVIISGDILGILLAQLAMHYNAIPILINRDERILRQAQKLGIIYTINSIDSDPQENIQSITGGNNAEKLAMLGSSSISIARSILFLVQGGSMVVVNSNNDYNEKLETASPAVGIAKKQVSIIGINNGYPKISQAINLLTNKIIQVKQFVSAEIKFDEVKKYFDDSIQNPTKYTKIVVKN